MLTCKKLVENGSEFLEGDMSSWQRFKFKFHMFMCVHCKRYMFQLKQTIGMISSNTSPQPSEEVEQKICEKYAQMMNEKNHSES